MKNIEINSTENFKSEIAIESGLVKNISDFFEDKKYFLSDFTTNFLSINSFKLLNIFPGFLFNSDLISSKTLDVS